MIEFFFFYPLHICFSLQLFWGVTLEKTKTKLFCVIFIFYFFSLLATGQAARLYIPSTLVVQGLIERTSLICWGDK